jgi:hypothetical protein
LERILAYLQKTHTSQPPRVLSTTYDAIAKRAQRRGYVVRKVESNYTMARGDEGVIAGALSELAAYLANEGPVSRTRNGTRPRKQ